MSRITKRASYKKEEIEGFFEETLRFTKALREVLDFERFGKVPLTQTEMNLAASESLQKAESDLNAIATEAREFASQFTFSGLPSPSGEGRSWLEYLNASQEKWLQYRNAECDFEWFLNQGGTIHPTLWYGTAEELTKARYEQLRKWLDFQRRL